MLGTALGRGSAWATAGATLRSPPRSVRCARGCRTSSTAASGAPATTRASASHDFLDDLRAGRAEPEAVEPLLRELLADPTLELRFFLPATRST